MELISNQIQMDQEQIASHVVNKDQVLRTVAGTLLNEAKNGKGVNDQLLHQTVDDWLRMQEQQVEWL